LLTVVVGTAQHSESAPGRRSLRMVTREPCSAVNRTAAPVYSALARRGGAGAARRSR
jgi:hypothetical protein